jgi:hypothetical protein
MALSLMTMVRHNVLLRKYYLLIVAAAIVGSIHSAPYVFFISSAGSRYAGITMEMIDDQSTYLARIHEVVDGHWSMSSPYYYEYKNELATLTSIYEYFYALPSILFHVSPSVIDLAYKFILPFLLTILSYMLFMVFVGRPYTSSLNIAGITTALMITLGYDLVDYGASFNLIVHGSEWTRTLLWNRPVNPICGALFLFLFLISIFSLYKKSTRPISYILLAMSTLAVMFASYYFSWGLALAILFFLTVIASLRRDRQFVQQSLLVLGGGVLLSTPYWYNVYRLSASANHSTNALLSGLLPSHEPVLNKLLIATMLYLLVLLFTRRKAAQFSMSQPWVAFALACTIGGFAAFIQQIITGMSIWPFHFVQYTIPLTYILLIASMYYLFAEKWRKIFISCLIGISLATLSFGSIIQVRAYSNTLRSAYDLQRYGVLFNWLDAHTAVDSVVLVNDQSDMLSDMIPAYTHANVYTARYRATIMPDAADRFRHNYFTLLRLRGITDSQILTYLQEHQPEVRTYLAMNWKDAFDDQRFRDVPPIDLTKLIATTADEYRVFYANSIMTELKKYRLDYIVSSADLDWLLKDSEGKSLEHIVVGEYWVYPMNAL